MEVNPYLSFKEQCEAGFSLSIQIEHGGGRAHLSRINCEGSNQPT